MAGHDAARDAVQEDGRPRGRWLARLPLRLLLTLPFLLVVVGLAGMLALLHHRSGERAVDQWSGQLMDETVYRIGRTVERQVGASAKVLEAAFPAGVAAPVSVAAELPALRRRFWVATSVARTPNNYAYYGDRQGHFLGLWRHSDQEAELRLRTDGSGPRRVMRFNGIDGPLGAARQEERVFEPRQRPWYWVGASARKAAWSPIYVDFKTGELVITLAKRIETEQGELAGVAATDLSLAAIGQMLQRLRLPPEGLAMVVERDGGLIGLSRGTPVARSEDDRPQRLNAADSADPLVASAYAALRQELGADQGQAAFDEGDPRANTRRLLLPDGSEAQLAWARLRDDAGLDWLTAVVVPRRALLKEVRADFRDTLWLGLAASLAAVIFGLVVLRTVRGELLRLADVAHRIGAGEGPVPVETSRRDELGDLGRSLSLMQARLLTDWLTGVSNRDAALRRVTERIVLRRRRDDGAKLALLFVDFDDFKQINDRFGHEAGDQVLKEMAQRLARRVRTHDMVARFAGDEFIVVLDPVGSREDAELVREQLEATLREPLTSLQEQGAADFPHGASIGVAMYPDDAADVESLVRRADADMYERKGRAPRR